MTRKRNLINAITANDLSSIDRLLNPIKVDYQKENGKIWMHITSSNSNHLFKIPHNKRDENSKNAQYEKR